MYLLNGVILNLQARNTENIVPATLHKFASRIKHWYKDMLICAQFEKVYILGSVMYILYVQVRQVIMLCFNYILL